MQTLQRPLRFTRAFLSWTVLVTAPAPCLLAAPLAWTGAGATGLWSDAANWSPLRVPADGDELWFGTAPASGTSVLDLARSFSVLTFDSGARAFSLHVQGDGTAMMAFTGAGLRNLTAGTGPIRQHLFADAGSTGGVLRFNGASGINVGLGEAARPVNLTAFGGASAAAIGGQLVFLDSASAGTVTFDALRAEGASAAAATGGEIAFADNAVAGRSVSLTISGGSVVGAAGAQASFQGQARMEGALNLLAASNGGLGARATFAGNATLAATASIVTEGAGAGATGAEGRVMLRDDARLVGGVYNGAGRAAGASGAVLELSGRASHDTLGPGVGSVTILNIGASVAGAQGGRSVWRDDAFVAGTQLRIENRADAEGAAPGSTGGSTSFLDRSLAGQAVIVNQGAWTSGPGTAGGTLRFADDASAGNARIESEGGHALDAPGGATSFAGRSQAAGAELLNGGGAAAGAFGARLSFVDDANAGNASIVNAAAQVSNAAGATTSFAGASRAGTAFISNDTRSSLGGGLGGSTAFADVASAQRARIDNHGGLSIGDAASTSFRDQASADDAVIVNFGGRRAGAFGGSTVFAGQTSAGRATLVLAAGGVDQALGGSVVFSGDSSAAAATLDLRAATVRGAVGGQAYFRDRASAGTARVTVQGSSIDDPLGPEGAALSFTNSATAGNASITLGGNAFAGGGVARLQFTGTADAGSSSLTLLAGMDRGGSVSFEGTDAGNVASAADARLTNGGSSSGAAHGLAIGGQTNFLAHSTAARATITNEPGTGAGSTSFFAVSTAGEATIVNLGGAAGEDGGGTQFNNTSTAARAVILNRAGERGSAGFDAAGVTRFVNQSSAGTALVTAAGAGSATAIGGLVSFGDNANPDRATLIAEAGIGGGSGGGSGGRIRFGGSTNSSVARVILQGSAGAADGGSLDISSLAAGVGGVAIGSLEGGGIVQLGGKSLALWSSGTPTTFSGVIRDGGVGGGSGGSLHITGGATLTLTGANTYSGSTRIGDGLTAGSGKLIVNNASGSATGSGPVAVRRGGTLGGSGFIGGPVTLDEGGLIAPGDPVTLTVRDSLTWNGGGVIRLVLGADTAGSDHLAIGSLIRGTDGTEGTFTFELVDAGIVVGQAYDFISFDSMVGFAATDFTVVGAGGSFALDNGRLGFTVSAVPEPGTAALLIAGVLCIAWRSRRRGTRRH